jgi:hypothetical protein
MSTPIGNTAGERSAAANGAPGELPARARSQATPRSFDRYVGCNSCGRVTHGAVDHRLCALRFDDGSRMPTHERNANGLIACVVLLLTLATLASLRMPQPIEPAPSEFQPTWTGPKPEAVQLAGVREQRSSTSE